MTDDSQQRLYLQSLSEAELIHQVLMPLLARMGLRDIVEYHGGSAEKGKDIVCHYSDILGQRHYVGIVVKRGDIHGAVGKPGNASEVLFQVEQALNEPFSDIYELTPADVSECWVITSGEIKNTALESIRGKLHKSNLDKTTRMIDVRKLVGLINEHMLEFWFHDRMLRSLAHEMRSLLGAAQSRAHYLAHHPDQPDGRVVREAAAEIADELGLLGRLVDMASALRRQVLSPRFRPHRLHELLRHTVSSVERMLSRQRLTTHIVKVEDLESVEPIVTDEEFFQQVVFNLLHNSTDYSGRDHAEVEITPTVTSKCCLARGSEEKIPAFVEQELGMLAGLALAPPPSSTMASRTANA